MDTSNWGYWRGNYRGCVGYSETARFSPTKGPWESGPFSIRFLQGSRAYDSKLSGNPPEQIRLCEITDGTTHTLLISEGISPLLSTVYTGPLGGVIAGNIGGALFNAKLAPNSSESDIVERMCPRLAGDFEYPAGCMVGASVASITSAARSYHRGGVVASKVDGSVSFVFDDIDLAIWQASGTRAGNEVPVATE
jgi:hypothetical protein